MQKAIRANRELDLAHTIYFTIVRAINCIKAVQQREIIFAVKRQSHYKMSVSLSLFCWRNWRLWEHVRYFLLSASTLLITFYIQSVYGVHVLVCKFCAIWMELGQGTLWELGGLVWERFPTLPPFVSLHPPYHPSSPANTRFSSHLEKRGSSQAFS